MSWHSELDAEQRGLTRMYLPDAVVIRRTSYGWSAYSGDNLYGSYGENECLIASADSPGSLADYIITLEPSEIIIQTGEIQQDP